MTKNGDIRHDGKFHWYEKKIAHYGKITYWEAKLEDIFDAPMLYLAYPQLKNSCVTATNEDSAASYRTLCGEAWIDINPRYVDENGHIIQTPANIYEKYLPLGNLRDTLLHEIQHAIQHIEGFARGSNPKKFKREFEDTKEYCKNKISIIYLYIN